MGIWRKSESAPAAAPALFALRGRDRRSLAATLERLALIAPRLSGPDRQDLAAQWCREAAPETGAGVSGAAGAGAGRPGAGDGEIRVAFLAGQPRGDQGQPLQRGGERPPVLPAQCEKRGRGRRCAF